MIHEGATGGAALGQRPAKSMNYLTFLVKFWLDLPNFFNANAVVLRVFPFIKPKVGDQFFTQMTTTAFSEERVPRV